MPWWIRNEDNNQVYGPYQIQARRRHEATSKRKIVVERSADGIPTLRAWFGRFEKQGYELAYPRPSGD